MALTPPFNEPNSVDPDAQRIYGEKVAVDKGELIALLEAALEQDPRTEVWRRARQMFITLGVEYRAKT